MVAESQVDGVPITLFVDNLDGLVTPAGDGPVRGPAMARLEHHAPAAIAVSG
ncbi:MAG: hypothetical protein QOG89_1293, partial [Thermomicrobiales bacterium]|nr:hypothetical protein [Thermomicrobiales bacterium]